MGVATGVAEGVAVEAVGDEVGDGVGDGVGDEVGDEEGLEDGACVAVEVSQVSPIQPAGHRQRYPLELSFSNVPLLRHIRCLGRQ